MPGLCQKSPKFGQSRKKCIVDMTGTTHNINVLLWHMYCLNVWKVLNAKFAFKPRHEYTPVKFHPPIDKKCSKKDRKKTLFCPLLNCPIACLKTLAVTIISHIPPFRLTDCFFVKLGVVCRGQNSAEGCFKAQKGRGQKKKFWWSAQEKILRYFWKFGVKSCVTKWEEGRNASFYLSLLCTCVKREEVICRSNILLINFHKIIVRFENKQGKSLVAVLFIKYFCDTGQ